MTFREQIMSDTNEQDHKQQEKLESLSALIDSEINEQEIPVIIDDLLSDPKYKAYYERLKLSNDCMHDRLNDKVLNSALVKDISSAIDSLPAHYVEDAVQLKSLKLEQNTTTGNWFSNLLSNRLISGLSVAASVMFVTLFTLQHFKQTDVVTGQSVANTGPANPSQVVNNQPSTALTPQLIQPVARIPANLVGSNMAGNNTAGQNHNPIKQQYQWIEADPVLSRKIREYIHQHDDYRTGYYLQPEIRSVKYNSR
jgi:negative regulator of sigma E activity